MKNWPITEKEKSGVLLVNHGGLGMTPVAKLPGIESIIYIVTFKDYLDSDTVLLCK